MDFLQIANANNNTSPSDEDDLRLFESRYQPELGSWILRLKRDDPEFKRLEVDGLVDDLVLAAAAWEALGHLLGDLGLAATAWGRLGHLLGHNHHLEVLFVRGSVRDVPGLLAGLRDNRHIKRLSFIDVDIQDTEHLTLFVPFMSSNPRLQEVRLQKCGLGQDSINILSNSLLRRSLDTLEELDLGGNNLGDIDLDELVQALSRNKSLTRLRLENNGIGRKGCASLARLLETQDSGLKRLHLGENLIDDESAITLADSLAKNTTLEELFLSSGNGIGKAGWLAMLKRVWNDSSIGDVVDSNHTLQYLGYFPLVLVNSLNRALGVDDASLLCASWNLNESRNKMLVARRKIIWSHVLGSLNVGDSDIAASFMPRILAWIASGTDETGANLVGFHDRPLLETDLGAARLGAIFRILRSRSDMMVVQKKTAQKRKFDEINI